MRQLAGIGLVTCVAGSALIHLLPLPGLLGADWLVRLYAIPSPDPATELLLRHRALTFALLGGALLWASRHRALLLPTLALVALSDFGFAVLALSGPPLSPALSRVLGFDLASLLLLAGATAIARCDDHSGKAAAGG